MTSPTVQAGKRATYPAYKPPQSLKEIKADLKQIEAEMLICWRR